MKMKRRFVFTFLFLLLSGVLLARAVFRPEQVVRGKSAAIPLSDQMTPEQQTAQELALLDSRVQAYTNGRRSEVFGVRQILADDYPATSLACATADCRQVEIYNFDQNGAVTAIVNLDTNQVLDVLYLPNMQPGINKRLADRAMEIAINAPEVIEALGYRPTMATMAPVPGHLLGACESDHLCAAPTFNIGERILWAVVDLTDDQLAGINWTASEIDPAGNFVPFIPTGCPAPGTVDRDGWAMNYETTGTDSLRVYNVTYNGTPVITSVKLVEWHADYGGSGYTDSTGCGGGGGGFPIYPYGDTHIEDIYDGQTLIGFEVVQDFRMGSWGNTCNYRYEQRIQFYTDGRFRPASGAYGKGCGTNSLYRPVVRIDIAVNGDATDTFSYWDSNQWVATTNETYRVPYTETDHGPHALTPEGYSWRIDDDGGTGYYISQDVGQYTDSRGDTPFLYPTLHHANEGDTDLGIIGTCCLDNHQQGPHNYVNNENIDSQNLVLWYVGQMDTDASSPDYYCWTLVGEPNPVTYPCITGPMFVPFGGEQAATAAFTSNAPVANGEAVNFVNTSIGSEPISYVWDFGDGATSTEENPSHTYATVGSYQVTLTATNDFGSDSDTQAVVVYESVAAGFSLVDPTAVSATIQFSDTSTGTGPLTYEWDFDDGGTSTEQNPSHAYAAAGDYTVTLVVTSPYDNDTYTQSVTIYEPATADFTVSGSQLAGQLLTFTNLSGGTGPLTYEWDFGDGATSTEMNPTHTYAAAGSYTVTLTVTGPYGNAISSQSLTIKAVVFWIYMPTFIQE